MKFACTLTAALALATTFAHAQFVHTSGEQILAPDGKPLHLRGTNLGNWMVPEGYMWQLDGTVQSATEIESLITDLIGPTRAAAFWQTWRDSYVTKADVNFLHEAGFNSIRVPMRWQLFATDDAEGFRMLDRLIGWAREDNMYLILDLHAAPGGQTGSNIDDSNGYPWLYTDANSRQRFLALWQRVAHRYKDEPVILGYDLLNEPLPHFPAIDPLKPLLEPLYKQVAAVIRREDTHHTLILEAANWDSDFSVFTGPFDPNTIYEVHIYGNAERIAANHLQPYLAFRAKYHVPLWLGESGEHPDNWVADFRSLVEANNIGWAFWPYKKMKVTSAEETFAAPADWAAIQAYAKVHTGAALHRQRFTARPPQTTIDRALAELLRNIQFVNCTTNVGYIRALIPDSPVTASAGKN